MDPGCSLTAHGPAPAAGLKTRALNSMAFMYEPHTLSQPRARTQQSTTTKLLTPHLDALDLERAHAGLLLLLRQNEVRLVLLRIGCNVGQRTKKIKVRYLHAVTRCQGQ